MYKLSSGWSLAGQSTIYDRQLLEQANDIAALGMSSN